MKNRFWEEMEIGKGRKILTFRRRIQLLNRGQGFPVKINGIFDKGQGFKGEIVY